MKASKLLMPTLREAPAEAEISSHILMMRAALISKLAAGVYSYLPLGLKVLHNVQNIIREEMDRAGAPGAFDERAPSGRVLSEVRQMGAFRRRYVPLEGQERQGLLLRPYA